MRKTLATIALTVGLVFVGAPAMASDAPSGPAPVGQIVTNGGCYTDAQRAAMTDAQLDAIGPNPDNCTWAPVPVGTIATGCVGDACTSPAIAPAHRSARHAHRHHRR